MPSNNDPPIVIIQQHVLVDWQECTLRFARAKPKVAVTLRRDESPTVWRTI